MSGDSTRHSLDLTRHPAGVLFGQGRVLTDADFGELVELLDRRLRTGTLDAEGPLAFSPETPDAFMLSLVAGSLAIGPGRAYVDGLQAECFGAAPEAYDPVAENATGTAPVPYADQPYFSHQLPPLPPTGTHLVYLDVWHREQGFWNEPALVDPAIGFDTSTRIQTVWQVRVLADSQQGLDCDTPDADVTGWAAATQPSAGRLTTGAVGVPSSDDPCIVPPSVGYRGVENRHYRVEVHNPGPLGTATFKWSRDNASIIVSAVGINAARSQLTVTRTGRDATLRFSIGDWVEITDEHRELAGVPGELRRITAVDDVAQTLTLATPALPADLDPAVAERRTRVIRWDQKGDVLDPNGVKVDDVDTNNGVIIVPAVSGAPLVLEDGVQVQFSADAAVGTDFHTGDAWCFAARTADASVQQLTAAAPRAVHHHFGRLGVWTVGQAPVDCRPEPDPVVVPHDCCDCTVCVTPESHASGQLTLQDAINAIGFEGGKVCVAPGFYDIERTLVLAGKRSLTLVGHGLGTVIRHSGPGPAVLVAVCLEVRILDLAIVSLKTVDRPDEATGAPADGVVRIMSSLWVDLERCVVVDLGALSDAQDDAGELGDGTFGGGEPPRAAVVLDGLVAHVALRDNVLFARTGVSGWPALESDSEGFGSERRYLLTLNLALERNLILAPELGVLLGGDRAKDQLIGLALHLLQTRLIANVVLGTQQVGIALLGAVGGLGQGTTPGEDGSVLDLARNVGSRVEVAGNIVGARGIGIAVGTSSTLVADNELKLGRRLRGEFIVGATGIVVLRGLDPRGPAGLVLRSNRVSGTGSRAIAVRDRCVSVRIEDNRLEDVSDVGIEARTRAPVRDLLIAGNDLTRIAEVAERGGAQLAGIRVRGCERLEVRDNRLTGLGRRVGAESSVHAVEVSAVADARVCGNVITELGPEGPFQGEVVGIDVLAPFDRLDVFDNAVRPPERREGARRSTFIALRIGDAGPKDGDGGKAIRVEASGATFASSGARLVPAQVLAATFALGIRVVVDPVSDFKELLGQVFAVRGNRLEAAGDAPTVLVRVERLRGAAGDNHVTLITPGGTPAVAMALFTLVFDANIVDVPARKNAVELFVADRFTVLGNIVSGQIEVNGAPLGAPWDVLNQ